MKSRLNFSILLLLASLSMPLWAANQELDSQLEKCIEKNATTIGMTQCVEQFHKKWDIELDVKLKELTKLLTKDQLKSFNDAHQKWVHYKNSEFKSIDSIYNTIDGTMYLPMRASEKMELVRDRANKIASQVGLINMAK